MLLLGVAAGFVWERLATPAEWEVREAGVVMDEAASKGQFSVIVVFVLIGAITSLVWGAFAAWTLRDAGWIVTPFVVVLTLGASVIAWRVGVWLGPPDPSTVRDASVGDHIPARLAVDTFAPFLTWPIFGLAGFFGAMLVGVALDPLDESQHPSPDDRPFG
ncbi:hypothetical protein [Aeromicrobium sp.]|uniref:hypothetical protein n=1 Tax=Aeromicrobium sp. TaxID=1871063 RepID=UPI002FC76B70